MREKQIAELEAIQADLNAVAKRMAAFADWMNPGFAMGKVNYSLAEVRKAQGEIQLAIQERRGE